MSDSVDNMVLVKKLLSEQYLAVLASVDIGKPYSNLIAFAEDEDLKTIVFITNRHTRKYRNIMANENVSLLIDSRTNQPSDFSTAVALTAIGSAREAENTERDRLMSLYLTKHPQLSQFVINSSQAVMRITVTDYIVASFDKIQIIHVNN
jgi:general stress protein 26